MKIKQNIPNFLTCCNLLCGCLAIVCAFEGNLIWSAYLVGIAAIFDFFDGFAARLLGVSSPIGKDLDSLADMVTFGVVPGIIIFKLLIGIRLCSPEIISQIKMNGDGSDNAEEVFRLEQYAFSYAYIAFLIPIFSAIRLAIFNNDIRQSDSFIGVPTPANCIFISSIGLINSLYPIDFATSIVPAIHAPHLYYYSFVSLFNTPIFLITTTFVASFLLVAPLPLFALKFKSFGWKGNEIRYVFLGLSLVLLITLKFIGIPLIIILYILLSIVNNLIQKKNSPLPEGEGGLN